MRLNPFGDRYCRHLIWLLLLLLSSLSTLQATPRVSYQVQVTRFEFNNSGDCYDPSSQEEYRAKVWAYDNVNSSTSGGGQLKGVDHEGYINWDVGDYQIQSRTDTTATQIVIRLQAYEEDNGPDHWLDPDDCQYGPADVGTINFRNSGHNTWTEYGWFGPRSNDIPYGAKVRVFWTYKTPGTPTLQAASSISNSGFVANWTSATDASHYLLEVSESSNFSSTVYSQPVSGTSESVSLEGGKTYYYRVTAVNTLVNGTPTSYASVSLPPDAPEISASDGTEEDRILIDWDAVSGAANYHVFRNTEDTFATATQLTTSPIEVTQYYDEPAGADQPPEVGETYYYWVTALNSSGDSGPESASDSGFHGLGSPANVAATRGTDPDKIVLGWDSVPLADGYQIYRNTEDDTAGAIILETLTSNAAIRFEDTSAEADQVYYYRLVATLNSQTSKFSAPVIGQRSIPNPEGLSASNGIFNDRIRIRWSPVDAATSYDLYRNTEPVLPISPLISGLTNTEYDDADESIDAASPGSVFYYWVVAVRGERTSGFSEIDSGSLGSGVTESLAVNLSGSVKYSESGDLGGGNTYNGESIPYLGLVDRTWPSGNDLWRAYFWWEIPTTDTAIEQAFISSLGYTKTDYDDDDWFSPRAAKIHQTRSTWNALGNSARYGTLNIDAQTPRYLDWPTFRGNSYTQTDTEVDRSHLVDLKSGNFGLGFHFSDQSGGAGDDSTKSLVSAGAIIANLYHAPALQSPMDEATIASASLAR